MRILLDNNVPVSLKRRLTRFRNVLHCRDVDWRELSNGRLVRAASERFDAMITIDKNMAFQTSIEGLSLFVLVIDSSTNTLEEVLRFVPLIEEALRNPKPGIYEWLRLNEKG